MRSVGNEFMQTRLFFFTFCIRVSLHATVSYQAKIQIMMIIQGCKCIESSLTSQKEFKSVNHNVRIRDLCSDTMLKLSRISIEKIEFNRLNNISNTWDLNANYKRKSRWLYRWLMILFHTKFIRGIVQGTFSLFS